MRTIFLLTVLWLTGIGIHAQTDSSHVTEYTVTAAYVEACELHPADGCRPIILTRRSLNDKVIVNFPGGGTQTDVYLYASNDFSLKKTPLLHDRKMMGEGRPLLRLTELPDGDYTCGLLACGLGGWFSMVLQTTDGEK